MEWDQQLASLKQQATSSAGAQKQNIDKLSADLSAQTAALKAKIDELKNKSPDEIKAQAEELLRATSGKIGEGLKNLAAFFDSKAQKP